MNTVEPLVTWTELGLAATGIPAAVYAAYVLYAKAINKFDRWVKKGNNHDS